MGNRATGLAALACLCWAGAAAASISTISSYTQRFQIDGWTLECLSATIAFERCEARRAFGPARVRIRVEGAFLYATVSSQCRSRPNGEERSWWLGNLEMQRVTPPIEADIDKVMSACGRASLRAGEREAIVHIISLLYGLRPGLRDYDPRSSTAP